MYSFFYLSKIGWVYIFFNIKYMYCKNEGFCMVLFMFVIEKKKLKVKYLKVY